MECSVRIARDSEHTFVGYNTNSVLNWPGVKISSIGRLVNRSDLDFLGVKWA